MVAVKLQSHPHSPAPRSSSTSCSIGPPWLSRKRFKPGGLFNQRLNQVTRVQQGSTMRLLHDVHGHLRDGETVGELNCRSGRNSCWLRSPQAGNPMNHEEMVGKALCYCLCNVGCYLLYCGGDSSRPTTSCAAPATPRGALARAADPIKFLGQKYGCGNTRGCNKY